MTYDAIIVGSGPAGATAAYHLAKRGRSALLLEKQRLPRYKPCGGGLSPQVQEWFDFDLSPVISAKVSILRCTWKMEEAVEDQLGNEPIWMVRREHFDHYLVQQAQKEGALLYEETMMTALTREGDAWRVQTDQGEFCSRYFIAADGSKGQSAKWLGFSDRRRQIAGAMEAEAPFPSTSSKVMHLEMGLVKNGYMWNFPKEDGWSIGVGALKGEAPKNMRALLEDYADSFEIDWPRASVCGHPMALWDGDQRLHTDGALLAGEAACLVDPFTAEGIRPAIFSGMQAAFAVDRALSGDIDALANYSRTIQEEHGVDMLWAKRLAGVYYRVPRVAYNLAVKREGAFAWVGRLFSGEVRYRDVTARAISRLSFRSG